MKQTDYELLIDETEIFVKQQLSGAEGGHDWWHGYRVWKTAQKIAEAENADRLVVNLASLLHDIADAKFFGGDEEIGPARAKSFLESHDVHQEVIDHVLNIIRNMSFKSSFGQVDFRSKEMEVVQDADRLDAMGAIGIARAFNYGGYKNRPMYDPAIPPNLQMSKEEYKQGLSPSINHFYEKLLLLKDRMNTESGKRMAGERHRFMEKFLERFYREWDGEV
ncbi:MAG: HD domain-containing protein [Bacteroidales bacterium]